MGDGWIVEFPLSRSFNGYVAATQPGTTDCTVKPHLSVSTGSLLTQTEAAGAISHSGVSCTRVKFWDSCGDRGVQGTTGISAEAPGLMVNAAAAQCLQSSQNLLCLVTLLLMQTELDCDICGSLCRV